MKKIIALTVLIFIVGCSFGMDKFKYDGKKKTVEVEKVETKKQ